MLGEVLDDEESKISINGLSKDQIQSNINCLGQ